MDIYPNNTASQYMIKLLKRVKLDGDWSMSLKEISTPLSFLNIMQNTHIFQIKSKTEQVELSLPGDVYLSSLSIICTLNRLTRMYNISFRVVTPNHVICERYKSW